MERRAGSPEGVEANHFVDVLQRHFHASRVPRLERHRTARRRGVRLQRGRSRSARIAAGALRYGQVRSDSAARSRRGGSELRGDDLSLRGDAVDSVEALQILTANVPWNQTYFVT